MALNAGIAGRHVVHVSGIDDVGARGMCDMFAAGAMAAFAANVPLSDLLCVNVIADGMAAVAKRACGAVEVVTGIKRSPPIASGGRHLIFAPFFVYDFPLHRKREIVIADFCEVTLLPNASVDERHLVLGKLVDVVRREIGNDRVRMLMRIADDIGHGGLLPVVINIRVTLFAGLRAHVMRCGGRLRLLALLWLRERTKASYVEYDFPNVGILHLMRIAPGRHASEFDTVLDNVMNFAVG